MPEGQEIKDVAAATHSITKTSRGPPMMIKACIKMLHDLGVADEQIAFDEF